MKKIKLKTLGLISLALIGGGSLASVPIVLTSCHKGGGGDSGGTVDKYINFTTPFPKFSQSNQTTGIQIGTVKSSSNFVFATPNKDSKIPTGSDLIIDNAFKSGGDSTKLMLYNANATAIAAQTKLMVIFDLAVADSKLNLLEEMKFMFPLEVTS